MFCVTTPAHPGPDDLPEAVPVTAGMTTIALDVFVIWALAASRTRDPRLTDRHATVRSSRQGSSPDLAYRSLPSVIGDMSDGRAVADAGPGHHLRLVRARRPPTASRADRSDRVRRCRLCARRGAGDPGSRSRTALGQGDRRGDPGVGAVRRCVTGSTEPVPTRPRPVRSAARGRAAADGSAGNGRRAGGARRRRVGGSADRCRARADRRRPRRHRDVRPCCPRQGSPRAQRRKRAQRRHRHAHRVGGDRRGRRQRRNRRRREPEPSCSLAAGRGAGRRRRRRGSAARPPAWPDAEAGFPRNSPVPPSWPWRCSPTPGPCWSTATDSLPPSSAAWSSAGSRDAVARRRSTSWNSRAPWHR